MMCSKQGNTYQYTGINGCGSIANSAASPHQVSQAMGANYRYDLNGNISTIFPSNLTQIREFEFDSYNQLLTATLYSTPTTMQARTSYVYGTGNERKQRQDFVGGVLQQTTHYFQEAEILYNANSTVEVRRNIGSVLRITTVASNGVQTYKQRHVLSDHLGSIEVITNDQGVPQEQLGFDIFGSRRDPSGGLAVLGYVDIHTKRGFTGHEHVEAMGIIHFGGRVFDPVLGRFLQADPLIEDDATQGLNRYSYVLNNPLTYNDPTGYLSFKDALKLAISIAISVYAPGIINAWLGIGKTALGGYILAGAASGAVTGGARGAVTGAFSAVLFGAIGDNFTKPGLSKVLAHGAAGGVISVMQGGKFGHGFVSNAISEAFSPVISDISNEYAQGLVASLVGGTASAASGGKFANGFVSAGFGWAFSRMGFEREHDGFEENDFSDDVEVNSLVGEGVN
ncbi:RHS repeat-associated core domain-containing protein [bacterium]|nr:RHS repeat-associated core domain-containing protein [bacterium]